MLSQCLHLFQQLALLFLHSWLLPPTVVIIIYYGYSVYIMSTGVQYSLNHCRGPAVWAEAHSHTELFHVDIHLTLTQGKTEGKGVKVAVGTY